MEVALPAPLSLRATRTGSQSIAVTWTASADAHHYRVERKSQGQPFAVVGQANGAAYTDTAVTIGRTYVYRVIALDADGGSASPASNHDLATAMTFTAIQPGMTVQDDHFQELLSALESLHAAQGWAAPTWSSILPGGVPAPGPGVRVQASHLTALRERMDAVLRALGVATGSYADDPARSGQTMIKAAHISALQQRAQ